MENARKIPKRNRAKAITSFNPNWVSRPGRSLQDWMDEQKINHYDLAILLSIKPELVTELLNGTKPITDSLATRLSRVTGASKQFWLNRQKQYDEGCERLNKQDSFGQESH